MLSMKIFRFGRRKVCKVNYTRTVSLPKVWLENVGLKPNDLVEMTMQEDGSLTIKPAKQEDKLTQREGDRVG